MSKSKWVETLEGFGLVLRGFTLSSSEITILDANAELETAAGTVNLLRKTESDTVDLQQETEVERRSGRIQDVNKQPGSLSGGFGAYVRTRELPHF